jgi:uncharacterized membrane protein YdbT with pleckstrin-like domain
MAFPRRLLTEGEEVLLDLRPHWKALVGPTFWSLVIAVATGLLFVRVPHGGAQKGLRWALVAAAAVIWWIAAGFKTVRWRFTEFVLTNERLIARSGVVAKRAKEIPLETINDITFSQSVLDRILGAGDIVLESAGEHGQEVFDDIRRPAGVQKEIYRAAEARKGLRRPTDGASAADELAKLADLRDRGVLTSEEFETRKRRLLES